jgi:hypothetical protein
MHKSTKRAALEEEISAYTISTKCTLQDTAEFLQRALGIVLPEGIADDDGEKLTALFDSLTDAQLETAAAVARAEYAQAQQRRHMTFYLSTMYSVRLRGTDGCGEADTYTYQIVNARDAQEAINTARSACEAANDLNPITGVEFANPVGTLERGQRIVLVRAEQVF